MNRNVEHTIRNYPKIRYATVDLLKAAKRKNMIHSIIEVDVTDARENIKRIKSKTKAYISITGYIIYCASRAVDENKFMHAYRNRKNQLVLFDDVDASTTIERKVRGNNEVVAMIVRRSNHKTASEISQEIKNESERDVKDAEVFKSMKLFLAIPAFVRQWIFRLLDRSPKLMKQNAGTIMVTSGIMVGSGAAWGIPIATHTLNIAIGGIVDRVVNYQNEYVTRQHLCLTISFDHDIIDGAPAARFVRHFKRIIERGEVIV